MSAGTVSILSVGAGDTKLVFDKNNPAEAIRTARIVKDMLRRGYALLVEWEEGGVKKYRRATGFDETVNEYIIADFDPVVAESAEAKDQSHEQRGTPAEARAEDGASGATEKAGPRRRGRPARVPAEAAAVVAVGRTAGG